MESNAQRAVWRARSAVLRLSMLAMLGAAVVASSGAAEAQNSDPTWLQAPRLQDIRSVWPTEALRAGRGGRTVVNCLITEQGVLTDCQVVSETPEGFGFGAAAAILASQFQMKPAMRDGKVVAMRANVPIVFPEPKPETGTRLRRISPKDQTFPRPLTDGVVWREAPTYAEVAAAYPAKARAQGVGGRATIACLLNGEGRLAGCEKINDEPEHVGLAEAALTLRPKFLARPLLPDGRSVAGLTVHIPVTFSPAMLAAEPLQVSKVEWVGLPAADQLAGVYPEAAKSAGQASGRARLSCGVAAGGVLENCAVASEEPAGLGFGAAAMRLAPAFQMSIWTPDGLPAVGAAVRIPLRFEAPAPAAAGAP